METQIKTYEGMFLLDSTQAAQDWDNLRKQVLAIVERRGGDILNAKKWAERKLAYEIKGHKRGTYFLVYFKMQSQNIAILRRDLHLSEIVLRNLILVHDRHFEVPALVETPEVPVPSGPAHTPESTAAPVTDTTPQSGQTEATEAKDGPAVKEES